MGKKAKAKRKKKYAGPKKVAAPTELKLDLGCGKNKQAGLIGVDSIAFPGVDVVHDLRKPWPWKDDSVDYVHSSHFLEHLTAQERCFFCNELWRVLKPGRPDPMNPAVTVPGGQALIITPNWSAARAYGDPTHLWPPVSEFMHQYLDRNWRETQAAHTDKKYLPWGYDCDFFCTWGFGLHSEVLTKNSETQRFMMTFNKEACQDTVSTWVKRPTKASANF